jgi:NAD dependent epimerase/dehydratase family enzyme
MFLRAIENQQIAGVYNATSPNPVTNREFMRTLRRSLGKPWAPPTPRPFVEIGARFILRTDASLALTGRKCIPARMVEAGFRFEHPDLPESLDSILQVPNV